MKYITKIILENFQSHVYSQVDFGPELNVIIGPSDSGKSSIIRALKWVMYNEPAGDFFIREGESECKVTLFLSDGTSLQRYRTKNKNGYKLIDSNGVESIFEGIRSSVPQEIIDITGIKKIQLDSDSLNAINLGEQLEGPFLLTEKASTRANAIGRLVGVDIVDVALREVLRDLRLLNQNKKHKEELLKSTEEKIKEFDYIDELKIVHKNASIILEKLKSKQLELEILLRINETISLLSKEIEINENILSRLATVHYIENKFVNGEMLINRYRSLKNILSLITVHKKRIRETNEILSNLSEIDKAFPLEHIAELRNVKYEKFKKIRKTISDVKDQEMVLTNKIEKLQHVNQISRKLEIVNNNINQQKTLNNILEKYLSIKNSIKIGMNYLKKIEPYIKNETNISEIKKRTILLSELTLIYSKLEEIKVEKKEINNDLITNKKNIDSILYKYKTLLQKVEKCPFCLGDINEDTISHIIIHHLEG